MNCFYVHRLALLHCFFLSFIAVELRNTSKVLLAHKFRHFVLLENQLSRA
jgi:hypothetical protein